MSINRGMGYAPTYGKGKNNPFFRKDYFSNAGNQLDYSSITNETSQQYQAPSQPQNTEMSTPAYTVTQQPVQQNGIQNAYAVQMPGYQPYYAAQNYVPVQPVIGYPTQEAQMPLYPGMQQSVSPMPVYSGMQSQPDMQMPLYQNIAPQPETSVQNNQAVQPFSQNTNGTIPAFAAVSQRENQSSSYSAHPVAQMTYDSFQAQPPQIPPTTNNSEKRKFSPDSEEEDSNRAWSIYLFGFLPVLFIPCLFVTGTLKMLRIVFIGLCLAGMFFMWKKKLFRSATRLIVTMVYVAMCVLLALMMIPSEQMSDTAGTSAPQQTASASYVENSAGIVQNSNNQEDYVDFLEPQITVTPEPQEVVTSEAEKRLCCFMDEWMSNNTTNMLNYVQPSWVNAQSNAATNLFTIQANRTPESYTIEEVGGDEGDTSRTITMTASINKNNGKSPVTYRFTVMMIKEGENWYVNPNSLATNDTVETETVVVNDSNSTTKATEAPRTTVTPEPPASTTLYYNPDGGSYYHIDQYCSSVRDEFLPLTGTFAYRELKTYMNEYNLSPCLKCGAPINPPSSVDDGE